MHDDEQSAHTSGGVPHAYRNATFWRWAPEMPRPLRGSFLTLLYALAAAADTTGRLRFARDGKPIRIQDIAKAVGSREKDVRRYINAAIAAGVLGVDGERRRGRPVLYVLLLTPVPDWPAAVATLETSREPRSKKASDAPAPWHQQDESSGHQRPNQFGPPTPELSENSAEEVRATNARMGSGHRRPDGSGHRRPNNPGTTQGLPQEVAEVGGELTDAREPGPENDSHPDDEQPELRPVPTPPVGRRARKAAAAQQPPLLVSIPTEHAKLRAAAENDPGLVRTAVEQLGHREALRLYGRHLVWQHAPDLIADPRTGS